MNARTLRLLELDKVLARLQGKTATSLGKSLALGLSPESGPEAVRARLAETTQARAFDENYRTPPFAGITDIGAALKTASVGGLLDTASLLATARFAAGARRLREAILRPADEGYPLLCAEADQIAPCPQLEKAIFDAIDDNSGEISDDASLDLLRARRNIVRTQNDIQSRLRGMLSDPNVQPHLQDAFVTVRDGRYCLPVRADSRARVPGIVHDRSGSGGAFFVEPQAVVELNNHLRELHDDERDAIQAILSDLSSQVAGVAAELTPALAACAQLDFAFAKAALSRSVDGLAPPVGSRDEGASFMLLQARHPLVENCIPNDIVLGENGTVELAPGGESAPGFDVMLITGPNTGGKTVVLKTLGLLTLMACCGLHIPVLAGSRLAIPEQVFADIGDEQSIEQSLSTFSAHIKNIVHILRQAGTGDLILLDEVGAGTDPDEGAALAKAVLRSLQRRGSLVIATTHYGELKQFALGSRRFENASVEFDTATLRPTYRLRIGIPGASNALDIAARLGMPAELVSRARRYLGRERAEAEEATQRLERTHRELADQTESAQRERGEIDRLRREYEVNVARIESEAGAKIEAARNDARALVRETQAEADRILRDLRSAARESKQTEQARGRLRTLGEKLATARQEPSAPQVAARTLIAPAPSPAQSRETLRVGDMVRVAKIDKEGELLSGPDSAGRVEVRVGAVKVQLDRSEIEKSAGARQVGGVSGIRVRKSFTLPDELNVIGLTTDEALPLVEKYIDDALMAESERVRIVHGRGTGVLRKAIHRYLKGHGGIGEFSAAAQNEGGDGATIVIFE